MSQTGFFSRDYLLGIAPECLLLFLIMIMGFFPQVATTLNLCWGKEEKGEEREGGKGERRDKGEKKG